MSCRDALRFWPRARVPADADADAKHAVFDESDPRKHPRPNDARPHDSTPLGLVDSDTRVWQIKTKELLASQVVAQRSVLPWWRPTRDADRKFASLLDRTVAAARRDGINKRKCARWRKECESRYERSCLDDRQVYLVRFKRVVDVCPPIASRPDKDGIRFFTRAFDPARIFKPVSDYVKEDVRVQLDKLATTAGFPLNAPIKQQAHFVAWRQQLEARLAAYLEFGSYSRDVVIAVECELERLDILAQTHTFMSCNGTTGRLFGIDEIMRRVTEWARFFRYRMTYKKSSWTSR
ncbi:hypothetical protein JCM11491_005699 [Sporobolomyces phaffii]